jgi:hypothetical protein
MRGGRLSIDGKIVATSDFFPKPAGPSRASDAETMADQLQVQLVKEVALLMPGHSEAMVTFQGDGKAHVIAFETFVGGKNLRPELGQPSLSVSNNGSPFHLVTANNHWFDFTDEGWKHYTDEQRTHVESLAVKRRANPEELGYWTSRHDLAREEIAKKPPIEIPQVAGQNFTNPIDAFIAAKLAKAKVEPAALTDDAAFLPNSPASSPTKARTSAPRPSTGCSRIRAGRTNGSLTGRMCSRKIRPS